MGQWDIFRYFLLNGHLTQKRTKKLKNLLTKNMLVSDFLYLCIVGTQKNENEMIANKLRLIIILLAAIVSMAAVAQKRNRNTAKKPVPQEEVVTEEEENGLLMQMLENTQEILFIDSTVCDAAQLLNAIIANPEEGRITTAEMLFPKKKKMTGYAYVNALGNKAILAMTDATGTTRLYASDLLAGTWDEPHLLPGLEDFHDANYPYLMTDGLTLYFAAKNNEEALGGYDIFRTRYDPETRRFLKPENIGMPFCSTADDMMYVVDEQNKIGFFATSRRQTKGKMCVYSFLPNDTRRIYNTAALTPEQLKSRAEITSIADTWGNKQKRSKALEKLKARQSKVAGNNGDQKTPRQFQLVINDNLTYTHLSDFKAEGNAALMKHLIALWEQSEELTRQLEKMRNYYAIAPAAEKHQLAEEILAAEQKEQQLNTESKATEKLIRNNENHKLNNI